MVGKFPEHQMYQAATTKEIGVLFPSTSCRSPSPLCWRHLHPFPPPVQTRVPPLPGALPGSAARSQAWAKRAHSTARPAQLRLPFLSTAPATADTSWEIMRQEAQSPGRVKIFWCSERVFCFYKHITVFANGERVSAPLGAAESRQIRKHGQIRSSVGHTPRQQWLFPQLRPDPPSRGWSWPPVPPLPRGHGTRRSSVRGAASRPSPPTGAQPPASPRQSLRGGPGPAVPPLLGPASQRRPPRSRARRAAARPNPSRRGPAPSRPRRGAPPRLALCGSRNSSLAAA